jgi:hypothetical protein
MGWGTGRRYADRSADEADPFLAQLLLHALHPDHIDLLVLGELDHSGYVDCRGVCGSVYLVLVAATAKIII